MKESYFCIQSDIGVGLIVGKEVKPYYEDDKEIIVSLGGSVDHHIRKNGEYFKTHISKMEVEI